MNRKDTTSGKPMDISEFFVPESGRTREHLGADLKAAPEIRELKSIVLGLEWEISDGPLQEFLAEVRRLEGFWKNDKIAMAFLRILGALGKYISVHKEGVHPAAIKLLHSCYSGLEEVVSSPQMSAARKTEIVSVEFKKYNALRSRLTEKPRSGVEAPEHPGHELEAGRQEISVEVEDGLQPALSHFGLLDDNDTLPGKGSFPEVETRLDQFFAGEAVPREGSASQPGMVGADYVVPMPEGEGEAEPLGVGGLGPSGPSVDVATPPVALDGAIKIVVSERGVASSQEVEARLDNFFADETAPMAKPAQAYVGGEVDAVVSLADFSDRVEPVILEEFLAEAYVEDKLSVKAEQAEVKAATPQVAFEQPPPDRITGADAEARTGIVAPKMVRAPKRDAENKAAAAPVLPKLPEDSLATLRDLVAGANPMRTIGTTQSLEDALYTLRATFSKEPDFLMMLQLLGSVGMHLGRHSALLETEVREESVRVLQALYVAFQKMLGERAGKGVRRLEILHEALAVFVDLDEKVLATALARLAALEVAPAQTADSESEPLEAREREEDVEAKITETSPQEEKRSSAGEPEIPSPPAPKPAPSLWQRVKKMFGKA